MNQAEYESDLRRRQAEHLAGIRVLQYVTNYIPCRHDQCPECVGTGIKQDGSPCVHNFVRCSCPKCAPQCPSSGSGWASSGQEGVMT
jgi:hypothetical protein